MSKKILIINGHPDQKSFNWALSEAYTKGAIEANAEVQTIHIQALDFNPNLEFGYREKTILEPDLEKAIAQIQWCDHMVWVHPIWWYGYPAVMKGFIDRIFLPGITFKYQEGKPFPKRLLKGKTAHIICTADTPLWYNCWFMKNPSVNQLKKGTLEFCGVKPVRVTYLGPIKDAKATTRQKWLQKVGALGLQLR